LLPAGQADSYLVSTFRLEPEHFQQHPARTEALAKCFVARNKFRATLTTGTFNLLSKTESHFRLSGALSVRTVRPKAIRTSSKPVKAIASRRALSTR